MINNTNIVFTFKHLVVVLLGFLLMGLPFSQLALASEEIQPAVKAVVSPQAGSIAFTPHPELLNFHLHHGRTIVTPFSVDILDPDASGTAPYNFTSIAGVSEFFCCAGLAFNSTTGLFNGTTFATILSTNSQGFQLRVTDANGNVATAPERTFSGKNLVPTFSESDQFEHFYCLRNVDEACQITLPTASDGNILNFYTLEKIIGGKDYSNFDETTNLFSVPFIDTHIVHTRTYQWKVTDVDGSTDNVTFTFHSEDDVPVTLPEITDGQFLQGVAFTKTMPLPTLGNGGRIYTLTGLNNASISSYATFDAATKVLEFKTDIDPGTYNFVYRVEDFDGDFATESFSVKVLEDDAPIFNSFSTLYVKEGEAFTKDLPTAYTDNGELTYGLFNSTGGDFPAAYVSFFQETHRFSFDSASLSNGEYILQVQATDPQNDTTAYNFTVIVQEESAPTFASDPLKFHIYGVENQDLYRQYPLADGGNGPYDYEVLYFGSESQAKVAGLTLNQNTGSIRFNGFSSSLPLGFTSSVFQLRVTDVDGETDSATFTVSFRVDSLPNITSSKLPDELIDGDQLQVYLPAVAGSIANHPLTYSVYGSAMSDLPAGVAFDAQSRILTVNSTSYSVDDVISLQYIIEDADEDISTYDFNITVVTDADVELQEADIFFKAGNIIELQASKTIYFTPFTLVDGKKGNNPIYSLGGSLASGLSFSPTTGAIFGTTFSSFSSAVFNVTVSDSDGDVFTTANYTIQRSTLAPELTEYSVPDLLCSDDTLDCSIDLTTSPVKNGNLYHTVSVREDGSSGLPASLDFDPETQILSFNLSSESPNTIYDLLYRVTDGDGSFDEVAFRAVYGDMEAITIDTHSTIEFVFNQVATQTLPQGQGGTVKSYALDFANGSALSTGFSFNPVNRELTINSTAIGGFGNFTLNYQLEGFGNNSINATVKVIIVEDLFPELERLYPNIGFFGANLVLHPGRTIKPVKLFGLSEVGNAPYTYNFEIVGSNLNFESLSNLTVDPATGILSGTFASDFANNIKYQVRVTDVDGDEFLTPEYAIIATPGTPEFTSDITDFNCTTSNETCNVTLPSNTQGNIFTLVSLTLDDNSSFPEAITFTNSTKLLAINATKLPLFASYQFVYQVEDSDYEGETQTFKVSILDGIDTVPTISAVSDFELIGNQSKVFFTGEGGNGNLTYSVTLSDGSDLPADLSFNASNLTLSLAANASSATYSLNYVVTDANSDSSNATFVLTATQDLIPNFELADIYETAGVVSLQAGKSIANVSFFDAVPAGNQPVVFTLNQAAMDIGLTIDNQTGLISGLLDANFADTALQISVVDIDGDSANSSILSLTSLVKSPEFANDIDDIECSATDVVCTIDLPTHSQGNLKDTVTLTFSNGSSLPNFLTYDESALSLSIDGNGLVAGTQYNLQFKVIDIDGNIDEKFFSIDAETNTVPSFAGQIDLNLVASETFNLTAATSGNGNLNYSLILSDGNPLPGNITFSEGSLLINVTASTSAGIYDLRLLASDRDLETVMTDFSLNVTDDILPTIVQEEYYVTSNQIALHPGRMLNNFSVVSLGSPGNAPNTFSINGASSLLGLTIDPVTGSLSGTVDSSFSNTPFTVVLTDKNGDEASSIPLVFIAQARTPELNEVEDKTCATNFELCSFNLTLSAKDGNLYDQYSLTLSDGSPLPAAIQYNSSTAVLQFSPFGLNVGELYTLNYSIIDADNSLDSEIFTILVEKVLAYETTQKDYIIVKDLAANISLDSAQFGQGEYIYELLGNIPEWVEYNASENTIQGVPNASGQFILSVRVVDDTLTTATQYITLTIEEEDELILPDVGNVTSYDNGIFNISLVDIGGNGDLNYEITTNGVPGLPLGVVFKDGVITGAPIQLGEYNITITISDSDNDNSDSQILAFTVSAFSEILLLNTLASSYEWFTGDEFNYTLPLASGGSGNFTYSIQGGVDSIPAGLNFNASNNLLSGNIASVGTFTIGFNVTDSALNSEVYDLVILGTPYDAPVFNGQVSNHTYELDEIFSIPLPDVDQETDDNLTVVYTVTSSPALPAEVLYNNADSQIEGVFRAHGDFIVNYTASNPSNVTSSIIFTITAKKYPAPTFNSTFANQTLDIDETMDFILPFVNEDGNQTIIYSLVGSPVLPDSVSFDPAARRLTGSFPEAVNFTLTYTATNPSLVSSNQTYSFTILHPVPVFDGQFADQTIDLEEDFSWNLPKVNQDPLYAITYSVNSTPALPEGVTFLANRTLIGQFPDAGVYNVVYTATNPSQISYTQNFTINVIHPLPSFENGFEDQTVVLSQAFAWQLPKVDQDPRFDIVYTVSGEPALPNSVSLTEFNRTLAGSFSVLANHTVTLTATNPSQRSVSIDFMVEVISQQVDEDIIQDILGHHAIAIADSSARLVKKRIALSGRSRVAYQEQATVNGTNKALNIEAGGIIFSAYTDFYQTNLEQTEEFDWSSSTSISQIGFDISSRKWLIGVVSETVSSSIDFDHLTTFGTYDLDIGITTTYAGYQGKKASFWLATSSGDAGTFDLNLDSSIHDTYTSDLSYSASMAGFSVKLGDKLDLGGDYIFDATLKGDSVTGSSSRLTAYLDWHIAALTNAEGEVWFRPKLTSAIRVDSGDALQTGLDLAFSTTMKLGNQFFLDTGIRILASNFAGALSETSYWISALWQPTANGFGMKLDQTVGQTKVNKDSLFSMQSLSDLSIVQSNQLKLEGEMSYSWSAGQHDLKLFSRGAGQQEKGWLDKDQSLSSLFNDRVGLEWNQPGQGFKLSVDYKVSSASSSVPASFDDYLGRYLQADDAKVNLKASISLP